MPYYTRSPQNWAALAKSASSSDRLDLAIFPTVVNPPFVSEPADATAEACRLPSFEPLVLRRASSLPLNSTSKSQNLNPVALSHTSGGLGASPAWIWIIVSSPRVDTVHGANCAPLHPKAAFTRPWRGSMPCEEHVYPFEILVRAEGTCR